MGLLHYEENENYRYGIWKMEESEDQLRHLIRKEIPTPQKNPGKRIEYLSVRALANQMDINPLSIAYHSSGKPYLKDSNLHISISHTKDYAALMLSEHPHIGTDIEQRSDRVLKVSQKFMHPDEMDNLSGISCDKVIALLLHWSAKEALFKAIPDEGVDFARELRISDFHSPSENGSFKGKALRSGMTFQIDYRVEESFVFTACFQISSF